VSGCTRLLLYEAREVCPVLRGGSLSGSSWCLSLRLQHAGWWEMKNRTSLAEAGS